MNRHVASVSIVWSNGTRQVFLTALAGVLLVRCEMDGKQRSEESATAENMEEAMRWLQMEE